MKSVQLFFRLLGTAPRHWPMGLFILMALSSFTEGIGLLLLVPMIGVLGGREADTNPLVERLVNLIQGLGLPISLEGLLICFLILIGFRSAIQYLRERLSSIFQHQVVDSLRLRCFSALLHVEWRWIVAGKKSDHANLLLTDVGRAGVGLNFGLGLTVSIISGATYLATAFVLSWPITMLALASGGLVFFILSKQRRTALSLGQNLGQANRNLHQNLYEALAGIRLTKIFGTETRHLENFSNTIGQLRQQQLRFVASTSLSKALFQSLGALLLALFLYVGITSLGIPLAELVVLVMLFSRLIPLFMTGHQHYHHWLHAMPALFEIENLLLDCQQNVEPPHTLSEHLTIIKTALQVDNLTIHYQGRDQAALRNITLTFPAKTTTAIMGESGAGKSTLADVLSGLLIPDSGSLRIDGTIIEGSDRIAWRHCVAYVPQDVYLNHDSVRNNLLWGANGIRDEQLQEALDRAAASFIYDLPEGLDTLVGDGGVLLSGGERQRLALARALLRRPSLLILDEATSALDLENEARIRTAIENLHGDLTVVIIGHRLPTLEHADQVVVLEMGQVVAEGPWSEINNCLERN